MQSQRYNLFRFATRELSHSAFWAWVLQSVDRSAPEFEGPKRLGQRLLGRVGAPSQPSSIEVKTERRLPVKAGRADIWAEVDEKHVVVIENKRSAMPSRSQIDKYRVGLERESRVLHLCLLSTALNEEFEGAPESDLACHFIGGRQVLALLDEVPKDHPLIRDYHEWLTGMLECRERNRRMAVSSNHEEVVEALGTREGQWHLLAKLTESINGRLYRGTNRGGHPWTQFCFVESDGEGRDAIFYRVDRSSRGYYLSVKQYQDPPQPDWTEKKIRLGLLRKAWREAAAEADVELTFERPRNWGKKESEVAWLLFHRNPVASVMEQLPKVHELFLNRFGEYHSEEGS